MVSSVNRSLFVSGTLAAMLALGGCDRAGSSQPPLGDGGGPTQTEAPACPGATLLDSEWTPDRRQALSTALEGLSGEWPKLALATLEARIADGHDAWIAGYGQACANEDTRAQRCLDAMVWELHALGDLLIEQPERAAGLWATIDRSFTMRKTRPSLPTRS